MTGRAPVCAPPPPITFGSLRVDWPFFLAPMAGYTDGAFRRICREMGAGLVCTELVSADGLYFGGRKTREILDAGVGERPIAVQLFSSDDGRLAWAGGEIERDGRFDLIDLNMGCPVRKIVRRGAGAAMLRDPARVERTVARLTDSVALPVTVKLRSSWDPGDDAGLHAAKAAQRAGAVAVTVHARAWRDRHRGDADHGALTRFRRELAIPVIGNGGIRTAADAVSMLSDTGVGAVMVARGALGHPWIFREIRAAWENRPAAPPPLDEVAAVILDHFERTRDLYASRRRRDPEYAAAIRFRKHAIAYFKRYPGYREFAPRIRFMVDRETTRAEVARQIETVRRATQGDVTQDQNGGVHS